MTYRGVHRETRTCELPKHHTRKEKPDRRSKDIKSLKMGVQISCCIQVETSAKKATSLKGRHGQITLLTKPLHRIVTAIKLIYQFTPLLDTLSCSATLHWLTSLLKGALTLGIFSMLWYILRLSSATLAVAPRW